MLIFFHEGTRKFASITSGYVYGIISWTVQNPTWTNSAEIGCLIV